MPKVNSIKISSSRTVKLREEYFKFEASYEASVEDVDNKDVDKYTARLYERINALIDEQIEELVE